MDYQPLDWYWLADDGRVFASARQVVVDTKDAGYLAAASAGNVTRWPTDDAGQQTTAALQDVLTPYGIHVDLRAYALQKSWTVEVGGIMVSGVLVLTDDRSKGLIMGMRMRADKDPTTAEHFYAADGSDHIIDAATIIAISDAVADHVSGCFATRASVLAAITAGTVKSTSDVDAASWPSNS